MCHLGNIFKRALNLYTEKCESKGERDKIKEKKGEGVEAWNNAWFCTGHEAERERKRVGNLFIMPER